TVAVLALPLLLRITPVWTATKAIPPVEAIRIDRFIPIEDAAIAQAPAAPSHLIQWFWVAGALLVLGRLLAGTIRTGQIARAARPIEMLGLVSELRDKLGLR